MPRHEENRRKAVRSMRLNFHLSLATTTLMTLLVISIDVENYVYGKSFQLQQNTNNGSTTGDSVVSENQTTTDNSEGIIKLEH